MNPVISFRVTDCGFIVIIIETKRANHKNFTVSTSTCVDHIEHLDKRIWSDGPYQIDDIKI